MAFSRTMPPPVIIAGSYSYRKKIVAYRNDFCLRCEAPRLAHRIRTLEVLHLYFIPLLPLGFFRNWKCSVCGADPHVTVRTSKLMKWLGVVVVVVFAVAGWTASPGPNETGEDLAILWALRIGAPIAFIFALRHTWRSKPDVRLKDRLKEVPPADELSCALCSAPLLRDHRWRCSSCGAERMVV